MNLMHNSIATSMIETDEFKLSNVYLYLFCRMNVTRIFGVHKAQQPWSAKWEWELYFLAISNTLFIILK